jgi:protein SCO1
MISRSKASRFAAAILFIACVSPSLASAHVPIPPRDRTEVGRREVNTPVGDFLLTDQDGKPFRFKNSRDKLVLATFIFTSCPDVCPLLTAKFGGIQRALDENKSKDYLLLSISTDPERDTVTVLKEYAGRFKAGSSTWLFLTGSRQELAKVWKIFGVNVTRTQSGDVNHTSLTTLIDRQGNRRVDYYGEKWQEKEVLKDIQRLRGRKP